MEIGISFISSSCYLSHGGTPRSRVRETGPAVGTSPDVLFSQLRRFRFKFDGTTGMVTGGPSLGRERCQSWGNATDQVQSTNVFS